jgi:hypothetical protein
MSEELNLEAGKKYVRRDGKVVTFQRDDMGLKADGWYYTNGGRCAGFDTNDDKTIVAEYTEDDPGDDVTYTLTGTELRREMLRQVESCVCRDRQNTYGDAEDNFTNIAAIANVALQRKLAAPLEAEDVAIFSLCIKLARLIESPHHIDNWIDAGGYAVCGAGIMKRKELNAQHV